ncbi:MAG: 50S ribosomal protein L13 [Bacteroidetes bacterium]|nr:50S ribosomal protein L13 [Bacteroidota bacterium]
MRYNTLSANKNTTKKEWILIDAESKILGRLASKIAYHIRGKNKTNFTPNIDCGDNVVVINSEKIKFTGNKMTDKKYISHTGYPGGQRSTTPIEIMNKFPNRIIEKAVKGMLPKNRLGRKLFNNLYVYEGDIHPHQAQKPKKIDN